MVRHLRAGDALHLLADHVQTRLGVLPVAARPKARDELSPAGGVAGVAQKDVGDRGGNLQIARVVERSASEPLLADAYDLERFAVEQDSPPNRAAGASITLLPEAIADDTYAPGALGLVVGWIEQAPGGRVDTEHLEVISADDLRGNSLRLARIDQVEVGRVQGKHVLEPSVLFPQLAKKRIWKAAVLDMEHLVLLA